MADSIFHHREKAWRSASGRKWACQLAVFSGKLALSGLRSPYAGKLGVVEEGALADLLLVDGNPIENIKLIEDPAKNFLVIMKDGKVYKNLAPR